MFEWPLYQPEGYEFSDNFIDFRGKYEYKRYYAVSRQNYGENVDIIAVFIENRISYWLLPDLRVLFDTGMFVIDRRHCGSICLVTY